MIWHWLQTEVKLTSLIVIFQAKAVSKEQTSSAKSKRQIWWGGSIFNYFPFNIHAPDPTEI